MQSPTILALSDLFAGDVLLCYSGQMNEEHIEIRGYSHVAICLSSHRVLEADSGGVRVSMANNLLHSFDHIAVLRDDRLWDASRITSLENFAKDCVGKPFDMRGMRRVPERKEAHRDDVMREVEDYFAGMKKPRNMASFFCSQLIAESFIHVGIIDESAAVVLAPAITSPRTISEDRIYGQFIGYLVSHAGYKVPHEDRFRCP
ncbi:hypothetical protein B9Z38_04320 [Limnohabitans sp. MMS-10A-160]|jgi:hypothetical protein|nr:hypothetical protein B9Z43_01985 [Limnohabitans sp. MMS-10A-192]PUE25611.1 hypothetical protein B9Z38_04320 [Limnohabitans sp. MMS-10A-160]